jgi:hypothetical protein
MKILKKIGVFGIFLFALNANAQTNKATTARIIDEKNYVFVATTAIPSNSSDMNTILNNISPGAGGGAISLSGGSYDLSITPDSLVAYLPYYGRAYRASVGNDENGHKFTAKKFTYTITKHKKGGWNIVMTTSDVNDNVRMNLDVSESGYATLNIISNNKQSISYNGYLMENKKKAL